MTEGKMTELEKRWAEEVAEEEHECCGQCSEHEEDSDMQDLMDRFIACPAIKNFTPMVLIMCDHKLFVGGLGEMDENSATLISPLEYQEIPVRSQDGSTALQIGMKPVVSALGIADDIGFKQSMYYFLKKGKKEDERLVQTYADTLTQIKASMAGIQSPTMNDLQKMSMPNE